MPSKLLKQKSQVIHQDEPSILGGILSNQNPHSYAVKCLLVLGMQTVKRIVYIAILGLSLHVWVFMDTFGNPFIAIYFDLKCKAKMVHYTSCCH